MKKGAKILEVLMISLFLEHRLVQLNHQLKMYPIKITKTKDKIKIDSLQSLFFKSSKINGWLFKVFINW